MSLEKPKPKHIVRIWIRNYVGNGKYDKKELFTIYNISFEDILKKLKEFAK